MFAALPVLISRALPVIVKIATNPKTISAASVTGATIAASVIGRGAKIQGADHAAQAAAEKIHRDQDPQDYLGSPMPVKTLRKRVARNAHTVGTSLKVEAKGYRVLVTPPVHAVVALQARSAIKAFNKAIVSDPEHDLLHYETPESIAYAQEHPEKLAGCKAYHKRVDRYERAMKRLIHVRKWYDLSWTTPGQEYLDLMVTTMKQAIVEHEVRVDTAEAIYTRLLDDRIDVATLNLGNPYAAGLSLGTDVSSVFGGEELLTIRNQVLRAWLVRHFNVTDRQWKQFAKGFDRAISPVEVGSE